MLHYFGAFVMVLFPTAYFLLALLLLPLPSALQRPAIRVVEKILTFPLPMFGFPLTFLHVVVLISGLTFAGASSRRDSRTHHVVRGRRQPRPRPPPPPLRSRRCVNVV
jgi:hypothetical protein